jgi:hypothetical protein
VIAAGRQRQTRGDQRSAHAFARLGDGFIRQANDVERGQPRRDLNLDIDGAGFDALERHGGDALDHVAPTRRQSSGKWNNGQEHYENKSGRRPMLQDFESHRREWGRCRCL